MVEIVIKHDGSVPNVDAMEACIEFAFTNYQRYEGYAGGYKETRSIKTKRGFTLEVTEKKHPKEKKSLCSVIFEVNNLGT